MRTPIVFRGAIADATMHMVAVAEKTGILDDEFSIVLPGTTEDSDGTDNLTVTVLNKTQSDAAIVTEFGSDDAEFAAYTEVSKTLADSSAVQVTKGDVLLVTVTKNGSPTAVTGPVAAMLWQRG